MTTDRTYLLGSDALYREAGYIDHSRAQRTASEQLPAARDTYDAGVGGP